jgi:hypothetical protein
MPSHVPKPALTVPRYYLGIPHLPALVCLYVQWQRILLVARDRRRRAGRRRSLVVVEYTQLHH